MDNQKYLIQIHSEKKEDIEQAYNLAIAFANFEQEVDILVSTPSLLNSNLLNSYSEFDINNLFILKENYIEATYSNSFKVIDSIPSYKHIFEFHDV